VSAGTAIALARYARKHARSPKSRDGGVRLIVIASGISDVPRLGTDLNDPDIIQGLERFRSAMDGIASRIAFLLGPETHAWWAATLGEDPEPEVHAAGPDRPSAHSRVVPDRIVP